MAPRNKAEGFFGDFKQFLKEFKVIAGAVAFIIALTVNQLVRSLVEDVIFPLLSIVIPQEEITQAVWMIDGATIKIGSFLNAFVQFLVILGIIFIVVHYVLKWNIERIKK